MFAVRGVSKNFEKSDGKLFPALQEIDLDIRAGELVSIIGPSGCGKTTLLNLIAGFIKPTSGSVMKQGVEVAGPGPDRTMMFQDYALFPWLTIQAISPLDWARRNFRRPRGTTVFVTSSRWLVWMDLPMPIRLNCRAGCDGELSIARALVPDPDVVLMDEPFAALNSLTRDKLQEELLAIWSRSRKTFSSDHS